MFSTDFIFRQQENLVDNQKYQAGFRPLCNKILLLKKEYKFAISDAISDVYLQGCLRWLDVLSYKVEIPKVLFFFPSQAGSKARIIGTSDILAFPHCNLFCFIEISWVIFPWAIFLLLNFASFRVPAWVLQGQ